MLDSISAASDSLYTLKELKYLIHGGRIGHMKGLIASVLNIKPIIGVEAYVARKSMYDRAGRSEQNYTHITLWAQDWTGYQNLCRIITEAHLDGYYYKPRLDREPTEQRPFEVGTHGVPVDGLQVDALLPGAASLEVG